MTKMFEKTSRAKAMEGTSKMDAEDLASESFKAMNEIQEALNNLSQIIQEKKCYLAAIDFSMVLAIGCLGLPDVHNPDSAEPNNDNGVVPVSFVVGSEANCIALTNILTAKIFDARNKEGRNKEGRNKEGRNE